MFKKDISLNILYILLIIINLNNFFIFIKISPILALIYKNFKNLILCYIKKNKYYLYI